MTVGAECIASDAAMLSAAIARGDNKVALGHAVMIDHRIKKIIDNLTEPTVCHEAPKLSTSAEIEDDGFTTVLGVK